MNLELKSLTSKCSFSCVRKLFLRLPNNPLLALFEMVTFLWVTGGMMNSLFEMIPLSGRLLEFIDIFEQKEQQPYETSVLEFWWILTV